LDDITRGPTAERIPIDVENVCLSYDSLANLGYSRSCDRELFWFLWLL